MSGERRWVRGPRGLLVGLLGLALLVTGLGPATAGSGGPPSDRGPSFAPRGGGEPEFVPGELLVRYEPGTPATTRSSKRRRHGLRRVEGLPLPGLELVEVPEGEPVLEKAAELSADPSVRYAEPNFIMRPQDVFPNDPRFGDLWGLHNTGQSGGTPDADIDAPEGWALAADTSDIVVGVIDTGIDINHPDLVDRIWTNPGEILDGTDTDGNGFVDDINGWDFYHNDNSVFDSSLHDRHGTHVAGTIAATMNNGLDVAGVSQATIMPIKFLGPNGGTTNDAVKAIDYAIDNGAHITNNSWGGGGFSQSLQNAIGRADAAGQLFVAAAGNNTPGRDRASYPARYPNENIISVAATDRADDLAGFSNYSETQVDLGAPGVQIRSTTPGSPSTRLMSGTSMAAPHVTGAAVHVMARFSLPHLEVKQRLMDAGDPIDALAGKTVSGNRLNLAGALADASAAPTGLAATAGPGGVIDLSWDASTDPDVAGYRVFRETFGGFLATPDTRIGGEPPVAETSYRDADTDDGTEYFYVVRAVSSSGEESGSSNQASATADAVPPVVVDTQPPDGAPSVAMDTGLSATFSEAMDPATITDESFVLTRADPPGDEIPATVAYDAATMTATLTPDAALDSNALHVARVTTHASDVAGNGLASELEWSFRTDDLPPVVDLGGPAQNTLISRSAPSIEGTARDDGWVEAVEVAILNEDGDTWDGETFGSTEAWLPADMDPAEGGPEVDWSFGADRLPPADSETLTIGARARDGAGNRTDPPVWRDFVVDNVAPRNVTTSAGPRYRRERAFPVTWSAEDGGGVASFDVERRAARFNRGWGSWQSWKEDVEAASATESTSAEGTAGFRGKPGTTQCFRATATDEAGNSGRGPRGCTAIPLNNTQLAHRRSWVQRSGIGGAYLGTFSRSTQKGARLVRKGIRARHLAIVVTRCPNCGAIVVKWRGKNIRRIKLGAPTRQRREVIQIKSFPKVRKGKLVVVVRSRGKPVIVEGLGVSRV